MDVTDAIGVTEAHPAGRGEPAPLTPLSILPLPGSLGWAGIRFLRTQLKHKERQDWFSKRTHLDSLPAIMGLCAPEKPSLKIGIHSLKASFQVRG